MADVAKTNIVSNETHNGMLVDKNSPNNDSKDLTECSGSNHTNSDCSNRNSCSSEIKEGNYQEVDSFSELSFKTTDDISLQDLIESEFAARISNLNGDEFSAKTIDDIFDTPRSQDVNKYDELFGNKEDLDQTLDELNVSDISEDKNAKNQLDESLDDFISGPIKEDPPSIEEEEEEEPSPVVVEEDLSPSNEDNINPVNVFKINRPTEIPIVSNFDPFARIEEDSDYSNSNPLSNNNVLHTPDEFPFPESPQQQTKEFAVESGEVEKAAAEDVLEKSENQNGDVVLMSENNDNVMKEFCKTISDENLDSFSELNYGENGGFSKFHVVNNMSSVESVNNSFPNISTLTSPDRNDPDDFFQTEEFNKTNSQTSLEKHEETVDYKPDVQDDDDDDDFEISPAADKEIDFFVNTEDLSDGEMGGNNIPDIIQDIPVGEDFRNKSETDSVSDQMNEDQTMYKEEAEDWTTVEDVLKAQEEVEDVVDDAGAFVLNVTNDLVEMDSCVVESQTNGPKNVVGLTSVSQANGVSSSDSETETKSESSSEKRSSKKRRSKKVKKSDEKENISVKSSFSKFDQLSKKTVLHVRSVDAGKVQKQFNEASTGTGEITCNCKSCGKQVFQMEQIKAEKAVWHKNCFRCKECNKQLTVDTYSSHEGIVYCKPHFKELFKPKAVLEDEPELTSDKPDLGLEELSSLNVKSRYQVFERSEETNTNGLDKSPSAINVKRSPSILSKLAKFQKKGMDIGVTDDSLNGIPQDVSSSSSEEEEEEDENPEGRKVIKSKKIRERPMSFGKMDDVKSVWENGVTKTKEELREERKAEIQQIRSRLFMGKQVKMKEAYEQAVRESESASPRKTIDVRCEKAKSIKECFEKGEPLNVDDEEDESEDKKKSLEDEMSLFEAGISKKSRSLFLELDKTAKNQQAAPALPKSTPRTPVSPVRPKETESPEREVYRDPNVVRAADKIDQEIIRTNTTTKMLSLFRQMEEKTEEVPEGPKPLKCFTPPPDYKEESAEESEDESEEESEEEEEEEEGVTNPNLVRASDKVEDEYLKQSANAARAKQLRAKFEKWEEKEREKEREELLERQINGSTNNTITDNSENVEMTSIECTKSLLARFESMKNETEQQKEKIQRPKVNRFVEIQNSMAELCDVCRRKVYPLEKIETSGKIFHKTCFRCMQCNCLLRMESFTFNCGRLYCLPHFKQLFIAKGNYDEGFGVDQHKTKWSTVASF